MLLNVSIVSQKLNIYLGFMSLNTLPLLPCELFGVRRIKGSLHYRSLVLSN